MKGLGRSFLAVAILGTLGLLAGCTSSTPSGVPISISLSANPTTINPGQTSAITATVSNDSTNSGVTWSLSGGGTLSNQTKTTVTYNAPSATCQQVVSVTATSVADTSTTASVQVTVNGVLVSLAALPSTINQGGTSTITATVTKDSSNSGVNWSLSPVVGSLSNETSTSATYDAPPSVGTPQEVVITATSKAASCAAASTPITVLTSGAAANVQAVNVDGGPVPVYANGSFASATVCVPGSAPPTSCVTVDGLLVDTGSQGLRVLGTALNGLALQPIQLGGQDLNDCVSFADGSYLWGQVESADVHISGETASNIPIHVIADPNGFSIPTACSNGGTDEDSQGTLLANGILGVGSEPTDCELAGLNYCDGSNGAPAAVYWTCSSSGCTANPVTVPIAQQVTNPVVKFPVDNNGVVLNFPAVAPPSEAAVTGIMTFGIGTQTNNQLPNTATVFTLDTNDFFQTTFNLDADYLPQSFIDSGSNGYFIPDPNNVIAICSDFTSFFCPASTVDTSATNTDLPSSDQKTTPFAIDNTDTLFANSSNAAYPTLGGPNGTSTCTNSSGGYTGSCTFDWGLPFFYGNTVFTSIDGQGVPTGLPAAPWWAY